MTKDPNLIIGIPEFAVAKLTDLVGSNCQERGNSALPVMRRASFKRLRESGVSVCLTRCKTGGG